MVALLQIEIILIFFRSSPMDGINLNSECNVGCGCSTKLYSPVCSGSMQYFSACHAGCSSTLEPIENGTKVKSWNHKYIAGFGIYPIKYNMFIVFL